MLGQHDRDIYIYDIVIVQNPKSAKPLDLKSIIANLTARQKQGLCVRMRNKETAAIRLSAISVDLKSKTATLLVQYSDMNIADPAFSNLDTGVIRDEPKLQGEGVAVSAHLVLSLAPIKKANNIYLGVLERVPGLGKSLIQEFLYAEIRQSSKSNFKDPNDGKEKSCTPEFTMDGRLDQTLKEGLAGGQLNHIELIKRNPSGSTFDEAPYLKTIEYATRIKVFDKKEGGWLKMINAIKSKAKEEGYDEVRVRFSNEHKKSHTAKFSAAKADAGDVLYVESENVVVSSKLKQCHREIIRDLQKEMIALLVRRRSVNAKAT